MSGNIASSERVVYNKKFGIQLRTRDGRRGNCNVLDFVFVISAFPLWIDSELN